MQTLQRAPIYTAATIAAATCALVWGAMLVGADVQWTFLDFFMATALLMGAGVGYSVLSSYAHTTMHKVALAVGVVIALLTVWAQLAVGIV